MDGEFSLRRVRTNIWREEKAGHAGGVSPAPSRGDGRKSLHKSPLAFHIFHHCGLLSKLWFPLFERLTTREDAKVAVGALAHVRPGLMYERQTCKHATTRRCHTAPRASPGRRGLAGVCVEGRVRRRERDLSGRHFCLLCTLCPFVGNQDSGGKKSYYVSQYAHKRERNRATGRMSSPQHPQ